MSEKTNIQILCSNTQQLEALKSLLSDRFNIRYAGHMSERLQESVGLVSLLDLSADDGEDFGAILKSDVPCVINSQSVDNMTQLDAKIWTSKIAKQIASASVEHTDGTDYSRNGPQRVWVLCASTNGPNTLVEFLSALPGATGDTFIILQHLKETFVKSLRGMLADATPMLVLSSRKPERLKSNTVYICPPNKTPRMDNGRLIWEKKRSKKFSPCIDESLVSLANTFGQRMRVVVFTGMANDCLRGSQKVKDLGGEVWAQDLESATITSMPESVINAGLCSLIGTPTELAKALTLES